MLKRLFREIKAEFSWEEVGRLGANVYLENRVTGKRCVLSEGGYSPVDFDWIEGREDDLFRVVERKPPRGGSAIPVRPPK